MGSVSFHFSEVLNLILQLCFVSCIVSVSSHLHFLVWLFQYVYFRRKFSRVCRCALIFKSEALKCGLASQCRWVRPVNGVIVPQMLESIEIYSLGPFNSSREKSCSLVHRRCKPGYWHSCATGEGTESLLAQCADLFPIFNLRHHHPSPLPCPHF